MGWAEIAGTWPQMAARLDRRGVVARWAAGGDRAFAGCAVVSDLRTDPVSDPRGQRARGLVTALVRQGSRAGGDDPDAVWVLLHLMRPGLLSLAGRWRASGEDVLAEVVAEFVGVVRDCPAQRADMSPARLLMDTHHALWRGGLRRPVDVPESTVVDQVAAVRPDPGGDVELLDVFVWAAGLGVVSADDLQLLWDLEQMRFVAPTARAELATSRGVTPRTLRRRRVATLTALQASAGEYLADVGR